MISFTNQIKDEICRTKPFRKNLFRAQCCGLFLCGKDYTQNKMRLTTENRQVAKLYASAIGSLFPLVGSITIQTRLRADGRDFITVSVDDSNDRSAILSSLAPDDFLWDDANVVSAFISGVFLACGSIIAPQKSYHLEFALPRFELAQTIIPPLQTLGLNPKQLIRRGIPILYFRESEQIEDLLARMGAPLCAMEMMDVKILKEMRNKVNRVTNCETANIDKTVAAALEQQREIEYIQTAQGLESLPSELAELATLRLQNPELSLRELGQLLVTPLSRSGVNHRLQRLMEIAANIRKKAGTVRDPEPF